MWYRLFQGLSKSTWTFAFIILNVLQRASSVPPVHTLLPFACITTTNVGQQRSCQAMMTMRERSPKLSPTSLLVTTRLLNTHTRCSAEPPDDRCILQSIVGTCRTHTKIDISSRWQDDWTIPDTVVDSGKRSWHGYNTVPLSLAVHP